MFFARERARPAASARSRFYVRRPYASTIAIGIAKLSGEKRQAPSAEGAKLLIRRAQPGPPFGARGTDSI
jgi:hypothetical protein